MGCVVINLHHFAFLVISAPTCMGGNVNALLSDKHMSPLVCFYCQSGDAFFVSDANLGFL